MMKIIFLDIDGVLNCLGTEDHIGGFIGLCDKRIARFNRIIAAVPMAKIVISSTWRHCYLPGIYKDFKGLTTLLKRRGLAGEIIAHTPIHFGHHPRGAEIREWLDGMWGDDVDTFVVLDDDTGGMEGPGLDLRPHHIITYWSGDPNIEGEEGGLLDKHIDPAIAVLNGGRLCVVDYPFGAVAAAVDGI